MNDSVGVSSRQGKRLPPELIARVIELVEAGLPRDVVGGQVGISRHAVSRIMKGRGRPIRPPKPSISLDLIAPFWTAGIRIVEIAENLGTTPSNISSRVSDARMAGDERFPHRCVQRGRYFGLQTRAGVERPCLDAPDHFHRPARPTDCATYATAAQQMSRHSILTRVSVKAGGGG